MYTSLSSLSIVVVLLSFCFCKTKEEINFDDCKDNVIASGIIDDKCILLRRSDQQEQ